jgi:hypothetical protein
MKDQRQRYSPSRVAGAAITALAVAGLIALSTGQTRDLSLSGSSPRELINGIAGLLDARSPGSRTKAELTKSKQSDRALYAPAESVGGETERVLGKTFPPDTDDLPLGTPEELLSQHNPENQIFEVPAGTGDVWELAQTSPDGAIPTSGGSNGGGWIIGGSSGGGGPGGGGVGGQPPVPPGPVPSVPEPSTWAMMLLGAAMCGASMRRRNRIRLQTAA